MTNDTITRRRFLAAAGTVAVSGRLAANAAAPATTPAPAAPPAPPAAPQPGGARSAVRFGMTANQGVYDEVVTAWQQAESLGFDSAFVFDHLMGVAPGPPEKERYLESWSLLAALAAKVDRLRMGVLVTASTLRHPAIVAKMAATVDHVSRGRLIVGLGAGWAEREHTAYGIPFYTKGERAKRLVETVEVIRALFTQDRSTYAGKRFTLTDAPLEPKPIQKPHPPLLIGGAGPKVVQPLAAKYAQIWHVGLGPNDPVQLKATFENFDKLCRDAGRDPKQVERATFVLLRPGQPNFDDVRTQLKALRDIGMGHFILLPLPADDRDTLRRFAKEVIPELRG